MISSNRQNLTKSSIAALVAVPAASGAINPSFDSFTVGGNMISADNFWDIDGDSNNDANLEEFVGTYPYNNIIGIGQGFQLVVNGGGALLGLSSGALIDSAQAFDTTVFSIAGTFSVSTAVLNNVSNITSGDSTFIGFQFNPSGSQVLYGWAELTITNATAPTTTAVIEVARWAYDDSGAGIQAGAVPEPANAALGLGLLALGAAGLQRMRSRKAS